MLVAASFGVGERHGGVMEVETRMVVRGGTLWLAEQRATLNRGAGDAQSARLACQHPRMNAVTAWTVTSGHICTNHDVWHVVLSNFRCYHSSVGFQV